MSQLSRFKKAHNLDYVYYDIISTNFQTTAEAEPQLRFNETRTSPIVPNCGDYYVSIVRFGLDTYNLPNFICEIQPDQADVDLSIYSLTLEYDDGAGTITPSAQHFIEWVPQDSGARVPISPDQTSTKFQDNSSKYYYCYQFSYWLSLINLTFAAAIADLIAATGGGASPITTALQPVLTWDVTGERAVLQAQTDFYDELLAAKIRIYFNPALFALFNSFPSGYRGTSANVTLGRNHQIFINDFIGVNTILLPTNPVAPAVQTIWTQVYQEFTTTDTWSPVSSIVFTSNTIPIIPNQLSTPMVFNNGIVNSGAGGTNSNFANIITDMSSNQQVSKPQVQYNPSAEFRRIDMTGNTPLTNIDINVFWRSKIGELIPFTLASGSSASIKFLFERKGVHSNSANPEI